MEIGALALIAIMLFAVAMAGSDLVGPSQKVKLLAEAIADAEGFYASGDPLPKRTNNPGDLEVGDIGFGTEGGKTIFGNVEAGWNALYHQLNIIRDGQSEVYSQDTTFQDFANEYTGGDHWQSWLDTVTQHAGAQPGDSVAGWLQT